MHQHICTMGFQTLHFPGFILLLSPMLTPEKYLALAAGKRQEFGLETAWDGIGKDVPIDISSASRGAREECHRTVTGYGQMRQLWYLYPHQNYGPIGKALASIEITPAHHPMTLSGTTFEVPTGHPGENSSN